MPQPEATDDPGASLTALFDQHRALGAERAAAPMRLLQDAEAFNDGTPSERLQSLVKELHVFNVPRFDVVRILKVAAKRIGTRLSELEALYAEAAPRQPTPPPSADIAELRGPDLWDRLGLDQKDGHVLDNLNNAKKVLEADTRLAGHIWFDEFANRVKTDLCFQGERIDTGSVREWTDTDDTWVTMHMQNVVGMSFIRDETVGKAVRAVARRRPVNPPRDWMESLVWDGVERLPSFLHHAFGTTPSLYHSAVGRCFPVSIVARVYRPGCKVDTVPVFEGSQGLGKSQAIKILGGEWGNECHEAVTSKDFYQVLDGNMLVEIAEMHSFNRAEINRIKGVVSCPVDRYRAPYGRYASDHPRRTVLAGTTNKDDWNTDETGARRFWPVRCGQIDLQWLKDNRDQLFAEAVVRFKRGEVWWDVPEEAARQAQAERRPDDPWADAIRAYVDGGTHYVGDIPREYTRKDEVRASEILDRALRTPVEQQNKHAEMRVAAILTGLGWRREMRGSANERYRCWVRTILVQK